MRDYSDNELLYYLRESEEASDIIYLKYKYIIDIVVKKYTKAAYLFNVDLEELKQEAMYAFSEALISYKDDKNTILPTFITLCVERRVRRIINNASSNKNKFNAEALSLEYTYSDYGNPLMYILGDETEEPLRKLEDGETVKELMKIINETLSKNELEVCNLLVAQYSYQEIAELIGKTPKQVDNAIQRIRNKIKSKLKE